MPFSSQTKAMVEVNKLIWEMSECKNKYTKKLRKWLEYIMCQNNNNNFLKNSGLTKCRKKSLKCSPPCCLITEALNAKVDRICRNANFYSKIARFNCNLKIYLVFLGDCTCFGLRMSYKLFSIHCKLFRSHSSGYTIVTIVLLWLFHQRNQWYIYMIQKYLCFT